MNPSIYDWVKNEENKFETDEIQLGDNWHWNFRNHVQLIFHLKNGIFYTGQNDWMRAFKNIMEPILEISSWTEDIEVKDVTFFIEEDNGKVLSFLVKKYHDEVYIREHDLETVFDDITDSDIDYGGVLVQKSVDVPEVLPLNSVAFCDQTDTLGGPIAFKHYFSPDKIRGMSKLGWGEKKNGATITLEELCTLATTDKEPIGTKLGSGNKVPGKTIEVYIIRGNMPEHYMEGNDNMKDWYNQIQVIAFYMDKDGKKNGVTIYRKKEDEGNIKFFTSKQIYQRALGKGIGETLLHPQIWTNFLTIHKTNMLEAGSKVPLYTDDSNYTQKNRIQDMENLEITTIEEGKEIRLVPTIAPANIQLFSNEINAWYEQAQLSGAAFDPLIGKEANSGTTFRGQAQSVAQGKGIHNKRRGKRAKFIEELYRDWILPDIAKEIIKGKEFLANLSTEELIWVSEQMSVNLANKKIIEMVLEGKVVTPEQQQALQKNIKQSIAKKGNQHLIKILKGEFKDIGIKMGINISGKQKALADLSDKLLSIFQFVFQNPAGFQQAMQIPALATAFENILEYGGMSIANFSSLLTAPIQAPAPQGGQSQSPQQAQPAPQQVNQPTQ